MHTGRPFSAENLLACLEQIPPVELKGLALLRQCQPAPGRWFPGDIPAAQIVQATVEFIEYGDRCMSAAQKLAALRPIPWPLPIWEFGL